MMQSLKIKHKNTRIKRKELIQSEKTLGSTFLAYNLIPNEKCQKCIGKRTFKFIMEFNPKQKTFSSKNVPQCPQNVIPDVKIWKLVLIPPLHNLLTKIQRQKVNVLLIFLNFPKIKTDRFPCLFNVHFLNRHVGAILHVFSLNVP